MSEYSKRVFSIYVTRIFRKELYPDKVTFQWNLYPETTLVYLNWDFDQRHPKVLISVQLLLNS